MSEDHPNRSESVSKAARTRLIAAARTGLSFTGEVTPQLIQDICDQSGVHQTAFRTFFPTDDSLLDAVNNLIVDECARRLESAVEQFTVPSERPLVAASLALANSRPVDRGGVMIRARRRLAALRHPGDASAVIDSERRFVGAVAPTFGTLMAKLDRTFDWPEHLAVRVILDTYERSFEAWMLAGNDEFDFPKSPFILRTLPSLFEGMTSPVS